MDQFLACPYHFISSALAWLAIGRYKALSMLSNGFRPEYALWAEGTVAGGTPWMESSDARDLFSDYSESADYPEDSWYGGYWTAHMRNTSVWVDPEYVVDRMVNHGFVALQAQLCAGGCLGFIADLLTLNLHTAFSERNRASNASQPALSPGGAHLFAEYFWPTWVESGIPTATTDQIPTLSNVTEAMLGLTGCMCSIDLPLVFQVHAPPAPDPPIMHCQVHGTPPSAMMTPPTQ